MLKTFQDFLIFKPIKMILESVETVVWTKMIFKLIKMILESEETGDLNINFCTNGKKKLTIKLSKVNYQ